MVRRAYGYLRLLSSSLEEWNQEVTRGHRLIQKVDLSKVEYDFDEVEQHMARLDEIRQDILKIRSKVLDQVADNTDGSTSVETLRMVSDVYHDVDKEYRLKMTIVQNLDRTISDGQLECIKALWVAQPYIQTVDY